MPKTRNKSKAQLEVEKALGESSEEEHVDALVAEKRCRAASRLAGGSNALAGPSHQGNVPHSSGFIEKAIVLDQGVSVDLNDLLDRALEKRLPRSLLRRLSGDPVTSQGIAEPSSVTKGQKFVNQPHSQHSLSESDDSVQEQESDSDMEELIGVGASLSHAREVSDSASVHQNTRPFEVSGPPDLSPSISNVVQSGSPAAEVDPDLPPPKKPKCNFNPGKPVVDWARAHFLEPPPIKEQIKTLEEQYVPVDSVKDIISPIKHSDYILKGMLTKDNKDSDTIYFDRHKTEKHIYYSQHLLGLSYAPLMDALGKLANVPGAGPARKLIGEGIMSIASARHELSYARRELCRKIVRSDIAPYLFSNQPSYNQLFGGESIETQAKAAKESAKNNLDFIFKKSKTVPKTQYKGFQQKGPGKSQAQQKSGKGAGQGQRIRRKTNKTKSQPTATATSAETPVKK